MRLTIYQTLLSILVKTRSANSILYYIENMGGLYAYKTEYNQYMIPYKEWREKTIINIQHIRRLNEWIFNGNGEIKYEDGYVYIIGSEDFVSKSPADHIEYMCKRHCKTSILCKYFDEFYYKKFRKIRAKDSAIVYQIEYDKWFDLFGISVEEINELDEYITVGKIQYIDGSPSWIAIYI